MRDNCLIIYTNRGYDLPMPTSQPIDPFFLIVVDYDRGFFAVEGPMTDERPWHDAAARAKGRGRLIACGPTDPDREALATEFHRAQKLPGVPPGSILRPHQ
jgi:hypothetical protein